MMGIDQATGIISHAKHTRRALIWCAVTECIEDSVVGDLNEVICVLGIIGLD